MTLIAGKDEAEVGGQDVEGGEDGVLELAPHYQYISGLRYVTMHASVQACTQTESPACDDASPGSKSHGSVPEVMGHAQLGPLFLSYTSAIVHAVVQSFSPSIVLCSYQASSL